MDKQISQMGWVGLVMSIILFSILAAWWTLDTRSYDQDVYQDYLREVKS